MTLFLRPDLPGLSGPRKRATEAGESEGLIIEALKARQRILDLMELTIGNQVDLWARSNPTKVLC